MTIVEICQKYSISPEQFDKATRIIGCNRNKVFYHVESQSDPTIDPYRVEFNDHFHVLTCTCKAGEQGIPCWHKRAAMASNEYEKAQEAARRQQEQAEIEAQEYYRFEMAMRELEDALDKIDAIFQEQALLDAGHEAVLKVLG